MFRPRASLSLVLFGLVPLLCVASILTGCSDEGAPRSKVLIESINESAILNSDVYNNGDDEIRGTEDDWIPEEQVPIVVRNQPHDIGLRIRNNGAFGAVVIDRYEVRFSGDAVLPAYAGSLHILVPSGGTAAGSIVLIPASYKMAPPLAQLIAGGEFHVNAEVILFGEEEDSGDEVSARATVSVNVADWADL